MAPPQKPKLQLLSVANRQTFDLVVGRTHTVGRGVASDIQLYDPTISRRHAELVVDRERGDVTVRDLGSSNGTFINGAVVPEGGVEVLPGDSLRFGKVVCQLRTLQAGVSQPPGIDASAPGGVGGAAAGAGVGGTIVRQVAVQGGVEPKMPALDETPAEGGSSFLRVDGATSEERRAKKMALLLHVSQKLAGEFDPDHLLESMVDMTFEVLNVDRVSVLLCDEMSEALIPRVSKSRLGDGSLRHVPRSIAQKAVQERIAILTDNATADTRFQGKSVLMQSVRSAMCTPLMASADEVLGILYVDSLTATAAFSDEDLQFLIGFSGIAAATLYRLRDAERRRREAVVRSNFERYFAPNVAAQIAQEQEGVRPGGDKRPITILFSDIRGFTALSEGMTPDAIAQLLSEYFTEMVEVIFEFGGTLDKFIGDAVLALWGAPISQPNDADNAMRAALAMQDAVRALNSKWTAAGRPAIDVGIAINHGEAFAGNIGSQRRLEYTVIGDAVNVASRLCAQANAGEILITEPFIGLLEDAPPLERIDAIPLRGRAQPVAVYRVKR